MFTMSIQTNTNGPLRGSSFNKYQGENADFRRTSRANFSGAIFRVSGLFKIAGESTSLARFRDFSEVILDFTDVPEIGQPFADEIFRVFKNAHPETLFDGA